jgi:hypothetical protein
MEMEAGVGKSMALDEISERGHAEEFYMTPIP